MRVPMVLVLAMALAAPGVARGSTAAVVAPGDVHFVGGNEANRVTISTTEQGGSPIGLSFIDDAFGPITPLDPLCQRAGKGLACLDADVPSFWIELGGGNDLLLSNRRATVHTMAGTTRGAGCLKACGYLVTVDAGPGDDVIHLDNRSYWDAVDCGPGDDLIYLDYADGPADLWGSDCEHSIWVHDPNYVDPD